jgi:nicotinate-nucleotide pyrophosphorylase (carboxylating)
VTGPLPADLSEQVARALREDIGPGDVSAALIPAPTQARASLLCRDAAVVCGIAWFDETFRQLDSLVQVRWHVAEGHAVAANTRLCELSGPARSILTGERTALNFLQLLSGTATRTQHFVQAVAGTGCRILDTRKTVPGMRLAQKYAVRCGGGQNHRLGLYDRVLIKENHIAAAGSIAAAVTTARRQAPALQVEVEVETIAQLNEALDAQADIIMLDNFEVAAMREAVAISQKNAHRALIECSGGVEFDHLRQIALTGVDFISIGSLTKHVTAVDLSLRLELLAASDPA